jgi:hypothetical protein
MKRHAYYKQRNGGRWRKARVGHRCDWKREGYRCGHHIQPGEEYFDTMERNPHSSSEHGTYRICTECANEEIMA